MSRSNIPVPKPTDKKKTIALGEGTTFRPGPKDPSIAHLIDQVLSHGYVILPSIFTPTQVVSAITEIERLDKLDSGPAAQGGRTDFEGRKTKRIYALPAKSRVFDDFGIQETLVKLNEYFLQDGGLLSAFSTANIGPGEGNQVMHTDDGLIPLPRPRPLMGTGVMIALDPFTAANGATLIIPGSHLWPESRIPQRSEMIPAIMPSGSLVYYLNTVWHSGGANQSSSIRRAIALQYCQPWLRPLENLLLAMRWEELNTMPKKLLELMGFSTHSFAGHVDGRSPRTGVEVQKKRLVEWALRENAKEEEKKSKMSKL